MYDILTNPITLLCLGIVFLLISLLFFYFKRSISLLERAQMEQARILQSFITNMEMSQQKTFTREEMQNMYNSIPDTNVHSPEQQNMIPVSDDETDDDDDSDDETDDETDDNSSSDDETKNNEMVSLDTDLEPQVIDINDIDIDDVNSDVKVIHLQENLEEVHSMPLNENSSINVGNLEEITSINTNSDSDSDSDDDNDDSESDSNDDASNGKENHSQEIPTIDLKSLKTLNVQSLKQLAEDKNLITKGQKINKKELLNLLDDNTK